MLIMACFKNFNIEGEVYPDNQAEIEFTLNDEWVKEHRRIWNESILYVDLLFYDEESEENDGCWVVSGLTQVQQVDGNFRSTSNCNVPNLLWRYNGSLYCMHSSDTAANEPAGSLYVKSGVWYSDDMCDGNGRVWSLTSRGYSMHLYE